MIVALSSARILPGARDEFDVAARSMTEASLLDVGCLSYAFAADLRHPELVHCIEVWFDSSALELHMAAAHTGRFLAAAGPLLDGEPQMQLHHVTTQDR